VQQAELSGHDGRLRAAPGVPRQHAGTRVRLQSRHLLERLLAPAGRCCGKHDRRMRSGHTPLLHEWRLPARQELLALAAADDRLRPPHPGNMLGHTQRLLGHRRPAKLGALRASGRLRWRRSVRFDLQGGSIRPPVSALGRRRCLSLSRESIGFFGNFGTEKTSPETDRSSSQSHTNAT
jgi:hypothetical protein